MFDTEQQLYAEVGADHFWLAGKRQLVWLLLQRYVDRNASSLTLLDLGCGAGYALGELQRWGTVIGMDSSSAALAHCRTQLDGRVPLVQGSTEALPCRDGAFSLIAALDVFEHVDDDVMALRECWRILRPGGLLVLTVPAFQWLWGDHDEWSLHRRRYRVVDLRDKLERGGFEPLRLTYCELLFVAPLWLIRRVKRAGIGRGQHDFIRVPVWVNRWLTRLIVSEGIVLRRWNLRCGVSIIGIARKR